MKEGLTHIVLTTESNLVDILLHTPHNFPVHQQLRERIQLKEINLPNRYCEALKWHEVITLHQLLNISEEQLRTYRNVGVKCIEAINLALKSCGCSTLRRIGK